MEGLRGGGRKVGDGAGAHAGTDPGARFRFQIPARSSHLSPGPFLVFGGMCLSSEPPSLGIHSGSS